MRVGTSLVGICGSDLHAACGRHPFIDLPYRPGTRRWAWSTPSGRHGRNQTAGALADSFTILVDRLVALPDELDDHHAILKLQPGTVTALAGENGAGKSTLMTTISGQYTADHGTVTVTVNELTSGNTKDAVEHGSPSWAGAGLDRGHDRGPFLNRITESGDALAVSA